MNRVQNLTEPVTAQADSNAPLTNRRSWQYFDERLSKLRVNDVANIIERGRVLAEARDELDHGSFEATVKRHFDLSSARMYRIVAGHSVLSNRCHVNALPPSLRTLFELTKLPGALLREKLADGSINPKLERKTVADWRKGESDKVIVDGKAVERKRKPSLAEQLKDAKTKIVTLEAKLKNAGSSLFDLGLDPAEEIGRLIADNMSESRFEVVAKAAKARYKAKRSRPAG